MTTAIFSFAEDGGGVSTQPQTLETQRWGWGRGQGSREHQGRRSPPEGTWHCLGTAPCWCHTCLPAIPRGGLHLSLAPRTGRGPHRPCRRHRTPAPCPRLCQSRAPHWLSPQRRMLWRGCHLDQASLAAPVPIYLFFFLLRYNFHTIKCTVLNVPAEGSDHFSFWTAEASMAQGLACSGISKWLTVSTKQLFVE